MKLGEGGVRFETDGVRQSVPRKVSPHCLRSSSGEVAEIGCEGVAGEGLGGDGAKEEGGVEADMADQLVLQQLDLGLRRTQRQPVLN